MHPAVGTAARCGHCGAAMCRACFDAASWPRKLCATCTASLPPDELRVAPRVGQANPPGQATELPFWAWQRERGADD